MPPRDVWEARRHECTGECTGGVDPDTGRCNAWVDDDLWEIEDEE